MVLFSSGKDDGFTIIDGNPIILIRNRDPFFGANLNGKQHFALAYEKATPVCANILHTQVGPLFESL